MGRCTFSGIVVNQGLFECFFQQVLANFKVTTPAVLAMLARSLLLPWSQNRNGWELLILYIVSPIVLNVLPQWLYLPALLNAQQLLLH